MLCLFHLVLLDVDSCGRLTLGGMAKPSPEGERFDWVDIYIPTTADVDLGAWTGMGCADEGLSDFKESYSFFQYLA